VEVTNSNGLAKKKINNKWVRPVDEDGQHENDDEDAAEQDQD
jgi:hypothetical protein